MSEAIVVVTPETETETGPESSERILGQLEAETEHLSEEVTEAQETAEEAQETAEEAQETANQAAETAWTTRADFEQFRAEILELVTLHEGEDDREEAEPEIIELPEPEAVPEQAQASEPTTGIFGTLAKMLHG